MKLASTKKHLTEVILNRMSDDSFSLIQSDF